MRRRLLFPAIIVAVLLGATVLSAEPTLPTSSYLALVYQLHPSPTPIPPPIDTLVIPRSLMGLGYYVDRSEEITNDEAAATYHDPKAAKVAFAQQGRETSWFITYIAYYHVSALGVGDQVIRYLTPEGATQGQAYSNAETRKYEPAWQPVALTIPGYPSISLQRTFKSGKTTFRQFAISTQVGRYLTDVQVIGVDGEITLQVASNYAQRSIYHLLTTIPDISPTPFAEAQSKAALPAETDSNVRLHMTPR